MPAAAGARALLSAQSPCRASRLPRVAVHAQAHAFPSAAAASAAVRSGSLPRNALFRGRKHESRLASARGFHSTPAALARSDDPDGDEPPAPPPSPPPPPSPTDANKEDVQPVDTSTEAAAAAEARREKLKSAGYGSARARASRNSRVEEAPALELPEWFMAKNISLYEARPLGTPDGLYELSAEARAKAVGRTSETVLRECLSDADVQSWKERLLDADSFTLGDFLEQCRRFLAASSAYAFVLVYRPGATPNLFEPLRQYALKYRRPGSFSPPSPNPDGIRRQFESTRWHIASGSGALYASPLAKRSDSEYPLCLELLSAVRSQMAAPAPAANRQDARRPPIVVPVLNSRAKETPVELIRDIATDLEADVVHLDAATLAALVGAHLGQDQYTSRGTLAMLGYAAAEMNGRLASRPDPDPEQELGVVAVSLPSKLRSFLSPSAGSATGTYDGRWEDMKINAALDTIIGAVGRKRSKTRTGAEVGSRPLIIHLHDYVELSSLQPTIVRKLRAIADRMWSSSGRKVVLVGSSSGDMDKPSPWRDQVLDLGREGAHVIPFHASDTRSVREEADNVEDNLFNIETMLRAIVGDEVPIRIRIRDYTFLDKTSRAYFFMMLGSHLYDAQWVYRLATFMVGDAPRGSHVTPREQYTMKSLIRALKCINGENEHWQSIYPAVRPPYFSPLLIPPKNTSYSSSSSTSTGEPASNLSGAAASKDYNADERKLLSGLINAKDIHTTFNDIVVPAETKESLIGLTSLSLTHPEAFSYGVLKTERIPGCLLYGPPGTGKTLLAKAVAKESGASMLEVSAASINDKWLGQSEKNVQALFSLARKLAPCVIFLDEADALLAARRSGPGSRAAHRETITQFLREWDGLATDMRAFIMVATNRPFDLDDAVLRRLPRKILVDLPLPAERERILRVMLREETLAPDVDLAWLASPEATDLFSGSDLKNLCVSAAMEAVREEVRAREAHQKKVAAAKAARAAEAAEAAAAQAAAEADAAARAAAATTSTSGTEEAAATAAAAGGEAAAPEGVEQKKEENAERKTEAAQNEKDQEKKEAEKLAEQEEEYKFPARRVLTRAHFDKALREISASVSGDMGTLKAIRKFDEQYGDAGRRRRARRGMGFEVVPDKAEGTGEARVRQVDAA